ncbi:MAG: putative 2,3-bisphosphoglycerate-independent phosphoglycerate mutase [Thermodesulfobacterium commune]|jgi:2,3-bisphosphoglycerate-independent phosphoglycerate mutase|uniref:Probable 2,3-bisphosphoglycerate-independent phosphoglycerate mutase n=1 Tax=Thermodesulfobacterium commune TaxID=1741 RepID=A0A101FIG3_9BACT|nr:MAG: putative 2,3-bisphosphoglycerate-independent phosphoglycerate mutase [Thermodesulfobacterium commune]HAA84253.1 phosphoglycerate mutase [Thermodesulfobacterium commune]HCE79370.1 phosphoglycerate mutase [Thermodesulfobacterium commune]
MGLVEKLIKKGDAKIVKVVLDGVGDLPVKDGKTPLELAYTPNLDQLAKKSATGLHIPVDYGITPGSGPGHLGIFGYDPSQVTIGRGVLEALGVGIELKDTDIAVRGNFATVEYQNQNPVVIDRRAGRISTEENQRLIAKLSEKIKNIDGVEVILKSGMEHRFVVVFRFQEKVSDLVNQLNDTDPQVLGKPPIPVSSPYPELKKVVEVVSKFIDQASEILKDEPKANYVLLRGFSVKPDLPTLQQRFGVTPCCIATYPMYKGLASLVGMKIVSVKGTDLKDEIQALKEVWEAYDYFFVHIKKTDSYGEDGNAEAKIKMIEHFDQCLPDILDLNPQVLCITGDHSTPCIMKAHSWHPVPTLVWSPYVLGNTSERFTERECLKGELGIFYAYKLMPLLLAHAGRLKKFGA